MSSKSHGTELRVGIFVVLALAILVVLVFAIGQQESLFAQKTRYFAVFDSVQGLRSGSPVRVGGVDVGTVSKVKLGPEGRIRVRFAVREDVRHLIRQDSVASVGSKGLLGDMLLDIQAGTGPPLPPGSRVKTQEAVGISQYMQQAGSLLQVAEDTARNLERATAPLSEEHFGEHVMTLTRNLTALSEKAVENEGVVRRLLEDEEMGAAFARSVSSMDATSRELARTAQAVRAIAQEIQQGDGTAHQLIYGTEGARLIRSLADASAELSVLLHDVRTKEGTVHDLIYTQEADELVTNLTQLSQNLNAISQDVREGKGTLGALLVDPSIYEDIKRLVGDLERNEVLRALIRYSIHEDETRQGASVSAE